MSGREKKYYSPNESRPTIEILYHWMLRIGAVATGFNAVQKTVFYLSVSAFPHLPETKLYLYYMVVSIANAFLNIAAWWKLSRHSYHPLYGFIIIFLNLIFIASYFLFTFLIYGTFFNILLLSALVAVCVSAGLLCSPVQMSIISFSAGLAYWGLFLIAQHQNIIRDTAIKPFIPYLFIFFFTLTLLTGYISKKMQTGEQAWRKTADILERLNRNLENAHELLSRFVAPQLASKILKGEAETLTVHSRRKLTMFFSDIKDFTATTDSMEAEDLAALLNHYLDEMLEISISFGGTVAQISGDGLFIFFGAPEHTSDEDHALQCVRMAVAMQKSMRVLEKEWFESGIEHPFRIRCGINTGVATVGGFGSRGRKEYTAIGMQVNLAARLEAACEPGQILISHTTWGLIKDGMSCTEKESLEVKGFHRPIRTYRVNFR